MKDHTEPRHNEFEPLYNEVRGITNDFLYPSNSKIYGKGPHSEQILLISRFQAENRLKNRPIRLTQSVVPNSNPLGIPRFVSGISIPFERECHICYNAI